MNKKLLNSFSKYAALSMLAMTGMSAYILADTFFVAAGLGTNGLAALNLAIPIYSFISGIGLLLGIGGATSYSIMKAKGSEAGSVFFTSAAFGAVFGVAIMLTGIFLSEELSILLGSNAETLPDTNIYIKTLMCFAPAFILNNIFVAFTRNNERPGVAMAAMLVGSAGNILLDYLFIFPMDMGMFGAALATGLAPIIGMAVLAVDFFAKRKAVRPRIRVSLRLGKVIFPPGISSMITEFASGLVIVSFNMAILGLEGNQGVAAYGIVANLALVFTAQFTGIGQGMQPLVSSSYGAGARGDTSRLMRYAAALSLTLAVLIYLLAVFFAPQMVSLFNRENDPVVTQLAAGGIRVYFSGFVFAGLNIVMTAFFSAVGRPLPAFVVSISRGCVVIVPVLLLLSGALGIFGVWLAFPVAELLSFVLGVILFNKVKLRIHT